MLSPEPPSTDVGFANSSATPSPSKSRAAIVSPAAHQRLNGFTTVGVGSDDVTLIFDPSNTATGGWPLSAATCATIASVFLSPVTSPAATDNSPLYCVPSGECQACVTLTPPFVIRREFTLPWNVAIISSRPSPSMSPPAMRHPPVIQDF